MNAVAVRTPRIFLRNAGVKVKKVELDEQEEAIQLVLVELCRGQSEQRRSFFTAHCRNPELMKPTTLVALLKLRKRWEKEKAYHRLGLGKIEEIVRASPAKIVSQVSFEM